MQATVKWVDGRAFLGESGSGHAVLMDGPPEHGGRNIGIRPMEMLLLGMGGCFAFDILDILHKGRCDIDSCVAEISAVRCDGIPSVFTSIHLHCKIRGKQLSRPVVARAITLAAEKYCSASIMLGKTAKISHDFEIIASD